MRRTITLVLTTCSFILAGATAALAQDPNYPPGGVSGSGAVADVAGSQPTAFTGADVTIPLLFAVGLIVLAITTLIIGRRRAKAYTSI